MKGSLKWVKNVNLRKQVRLMVIFPIIIVVSFFLYFYYKIMILRTNDGLIRHYNNAKAKICLGTFILVFGIHQYIYYQTKISLWVAVVFVFLGVLQLNRGIRETIHYAREIKRLRT